MSDVSEPSVDEFVRLETRVWQALVDGDPEADARMLSDDFLGVDPAGFSDRAAHAAQLGSGPLVVGFELSEQRVMVLSDDTVMLSYRADYRRPSSPDRETMYVSSLWCRRDDRWVNVFSQDTPRGSG